MNLIVRDMDTPEHCTTPQDEVPHSLAFTVTFGEAKKRNFKKHSRNLSLPVVSVYENDTLPAINGSKKPGNYSEGYFSSDPEDEHRLNKDLRIESFTSDNYEPVEENNLGASCVEEDGSDVLSETGTYTIDKENPEVVTARLSIDASFGIDPIVNNSCDPTTWVSEWASQTVNHQKARHSGSQSSLLGNPVAKAKMTISKIPSPIFTRARIGAHKIDTNELENAEQIENKYETESYLKTTEKALSAIAARMSVSLDSGGESDVDSKSSSNKKGLHRSDSSASESGPKPPNPSTTRYNRAFSLRRSRLDNEEAKKCQPVVGKSSARGVTPKSENPPPRSTSSVRSKATTPILPPPGLSRSDNTRLSVRSKLSPQSPLLSNPKNISIGGAKKVASPNANGPGGGGGGGRSNSTLSSKEVDFQNWKRRKNYDPMKAAAEGKKKEVGKKPVTATGSCTAQPTCPSVASNTTKTPSSSVLRSASFHGHGTRQSLAAGPSSSDDEDGGKEEEEEDEDTPHSAAEDWPAPPQGPKTSLENTPHSSRVSLYSNNSNSPRVRHKLEGVDNLVVAAISGVSNKLRVSAGTLVKKLRYLYDEESEKYGCLSLELAQLETLAEAAGSSPQKSPSRELALALKSLKRLDATLKVLNDVLFDNVDYE